MEMSERVLPSDPDLAGDWPCLFGECGNADPPEWAEVGPPAEDTARRYKQDDVAFIAAEWHNHDDEVEMLALVRFRDGVWASVSGGADYTGWGCQDGVRWMLAADRDTVVRFGLTDEARRLLGLSLP